jgi:hypothetical protein
MEVLSASAGRVKAGASALPRVRLAALTRPADAGLGQSSDLRFGMSRLRIDVTPRPFVAQHGIAVLEGLQRRIVTRRDESAHEQSRAHADLPPPIKLLPFHLPDCRVHEATGERRDLCGRACQAPAARQSRFARSPARCLEPRRSSFSRQAGEPRTAPSLC